MMNFGKKSGVKTDVLLRHSFDYCKHKKYISLSNITSRPLLGSVDSGLITGRIKLKTIKIVFAASLLDVQ